MPKPEMVKPTIFLIALFLCIACTSSIRPIDSNPTAYEMLEKFDFPKGILPTGVQSYRLSPSGEFEVILNSDCEFMVDGGYLLRYRKRISGKVEVGSLKNLNGVTVRVLFMWFGIDEVLRNNAELDFYVGPLSASFSAASFEESPRCNSRCVDGNGAVIGAI